MSFGSGCWSTCASDACWKKIYIRSTTLFILVFLTSVGIMEGTGTEESVDVKIERIIKGWESSGKCSRGWTREAEEGGEADTDKRLCRVEHPA